MRFRIIQCVAIIAALCLGLSGCREKEAENNGGEKMEQEAVSLEESDEENDGEEVLSEDRIFADVDKEEILEGKLVSYDSLKKDNLVFELLKSDKYRQGELYNYCEAALLISKADNNREVQIIKFEAVDLNESNTNDKCKKLIYADVDFNGLGDLLVYRGSFGIQGAAYYDCYLHNEKGFQNGYGFGAIPNPCIDVVNKEITGSWRNWAASHSWAKYKYTDGKFVEEKVLTEQPVEGENQNSEDRDWVYDVDGEVIARTDEMSKEEIENLIYNESSEWRLNSENIIPLWIWD